MRILFTWCFVLAILLTFQPALHAQRTRQWVGHFSGSTKGGDNGAKGMAFDDSGNVIVAGWVTNKTTGNDFATLKYSSDGELLWAKYYDNSHKEDRATAVAVDSGNNVYVTGWSDGGPSTGMDFATIKYLPDGTLVWVRRYDGSGHGEDRPVALAVNDSLNVYVTGSSSAGGSDNDFATIKYLSNGDSAWVKRYDGGLLKADMPKAMALRGLTDLYVTGISLDTTNDYTTIKYNAASGTLRWVRTYKGAGEDVANALVLRGATDVLVTGGSQNNSGNFDFLTIKYDSAGTVQWIAREDGPAGNDDIAKSISVTNNGNSARVIVTGKAVNVGSYNDFMTLRYDLDGTQKWVRFMNGTANDEDAAVMVIGGSLIVVGSTAGTGVGLDYGLIEYNTNGNEQYRLSYNNRQYNGDDVPVAVGTSGNGTYVTGQSKKGKGSEFLTIKFVDPKKVKYTTFVQESLSVAKGISLKVIGNFPNVANVRDTAFFRAYPKIKKGFPSAPGGLVLGNARPDSSASFGWIRFDKGSNIAKFMPHTSSSRGFDTYDGKPFIGEKKNPKIGKYNNHLVGELIALRINIGASDAEVTPPTFGDITYNRADTVNGIVLKGMSLRELANLTDNFLTYWKRYPSVQWDTLDSAIARVNHAFTGPIRVISTQPLVITGSILIDSVSFLDMTNVPLAEPFAFSPTWIENEPTRYALAQNYPNPFNPSTTIEFELPQTAPVSLVVYDMLGREVAELLHDEVVQEGSQAITFDGSALSSGVYFYRIVVNHGEFTDIQKMVLLK